MAERIVDVLVPLIMEDIVEIVKVVFQERIAMRICEQIVDVHVSQATEVPKTSSRDRTLQRAVEQILDVPLPEMVTQLLEVPKIIPQDRILQRTETGRGNTGAPIRDEWRRQTDVLIVPGKFKCCFADIDRSQRIRIGDIGQTTRRAGALNRA